MCSTSSRRGGADADAEAPESFSAVKEKCFFPFFSSFFFTEGAAHTGTHTHAHITCGSYFRNADVSRAHPATTTAAAAATPLSA